ncbi:MAG: peptidylprolyl isomerase [Candidatus Brocadiae bacterium]|nr:peptidylprolyl isomerase [Candidatus Brocadiia bacterium]
MALTVNGEPISEDVIRQEAERMRPQYEEAFKDDDPEKREARLHEWARENVVERVLLQQAGKADPEPVPVEDVDQAFAEMKQQYGGDEAFYERLGLTKDADEAIREDVELRLRVNRLLERVTGGLAEPDDAAIEGFYEEHKDDFVVPEQVHVAHIVKHVGPECGPADARAELEKVKAELDAGADFAELAAQHSDCPDNGGDLGCFPRGQMVEEFEHIAFSMAVGSVSEVFPSRFGFHIAKLLDRKAPGSAPLDEVRDPIKERLAELARNEAVEKHLNGLRMKATVVEG